MPLQPKLRVIAAQPSGFLVQDNTGNYDAQANPGGWGAPNPNKTDVIRILLSIQPLRTDALVGGIAMSGTDQNAYLTGNGAPGLPTGTTPFPDGVYHVRGLIGFACPNNITSVAGQLTFLMTNADANFATPVGFTIDSLSTSIFYAIDRTKPLTNTGGAVTTALPDASNLAVTFYYEADGYGLVFQQGQACLLRDVAKYAGTTECCEGDDLDDLMTRYAQNASMFDRFAEQDYAGANDLAIKLQADCTLYRRCDPLQPLPPVGTAVVAPTIVTQPQNVAANAGGTALFTVVAVGTDPLHYQWRRNGVPIAKEIDASLLLLNIQPADAAQYSVIVWNDYGYVESINVSLSVGGALTPVTITVQPQPVTTSIGASATFSVTATGSPTITYQWRKNGIPITGATNSSYTIPNVQAGDVGNYDCVVSNPVSSTTTTAVALALSITARWGWADTQPATLIDVNNLQQSGQFASGGTIVADYTSNNVPKFLSMAEPSTEPIKTKWFGDAFNNGTIGTDVFIVVGIIGSWRVYTTMFKTQQTATTIQFKVS